MMFGVPDECWRQVGDNFDVKDAYISLMGKCGELTKIVAKHAVGGYDNWQESRGNICQGVADVLISMNLVCEQLMIKEKDVKMRVIKKDLRDNFLVRTLEE